MPKILAIDDINDNLISLKAIIRDAMPEATVLTALNGSEGIELAVGNDPDVILLDILMPGMDGFEVCRRLKEDERVQDIPVVFVTAIKGDKESRIKAIEVGAEGFLAKPIDEIELIAQISAMSKIKEAVKQKANENERLKTLIEERTRKIAESEAQFREFFNKASDAIFVAEIESGIIVDANEAASRLTLIPREKLIGMHQSQLHPPADENYTKENFNKHKQAVAGSNSMIPVENRVMRSDESMVPVEILASEVSYHGKKCLMGTFRDITERKKAEATIFRNEERFKQVTECSGTWIWEVDASGLYTYVNEFEETVLGYPPDEIIGKKYFYDFFCPETKEEITKQAVDVFKRKGTFSNFENANIHKDGHQVILETVGFPILDPEGNLLGYRGADKDITERKRAEDALRNSEEKMSSIFRVAPAGIGEVVNRVVMEINPRITEMTGYTKDEILGRDPRFLYPTEEEYDYVGKEKYRQIAEKGTGVVETRWRRKDGSVIDIILSSTPIDPTDNSKGVIFTALNITDRKKAEAALVESELFFKESQRAAFIGSYKFNIIPDIWSSSEVLEQIFGIDKSYNRSLQGWMDLTHPEDREMMSRYFAEEVMGKRNPFNKEYRIIRKSDGETRWVLGLGKLNFDSDGNVVEMIGTIQDITEKVRADKVQQVLYSISNAALSSIDLSELIEFISKEIGKLLDSTNFYIAFYDEETNMLSTLYERDEKDVLNSWSAEKSITGYVIKHQKSMRISYEDVQKLCNAGEIEMFGTPSKVWLGVPLSMNKKVIGALVVQSYDDPEAYTEQDKLMLEFISHQISISIERKKAEQELNEALIKAQESDRLKSAFLANMSHEIRTPLNSIIGFSELMCDPDFDFSQQLDFSRMINSSGNNLLTIITDIMDLSKIEAGQIIIRKEPFSVNDLIIDIQKEYSFMAGKKGIRLELDFSEIDGQLEIESDESALRKILINFVGNAIKFTREGSIEIGVKPVGKYLQFHVKDTGIGIPAEFHKTIFERFRQIESFSTRKYGGNGLGLAISKSLVELLDGKIWMESETGVGSTFYFAVPIGEII
ncbi:MAG TPA: hypothetical protein DHV48_07090 [Prolixibacteraceae bacterium]|nr:hypothetical protein [Prolixibacteraceae bacterium]